MPGGLSPADRRLLVICGLVAVPLLAATAFLSEPENTGRSPIPSTYSSLPGGARAAYLLLEELGYQVQRFEEPAAHLPGTGRGSLLILAEPTEAATGPDRAAIRRFLETGGRVLYCGQGVESFLPDAPKALPDPVTKVAPYSAAWPGPYTEGASGIVMEPRARLVPDQRPRVVLYGPATAPVAVAWAVGAGEAVWWAAGTPLTNDFLQRGSNLRLLLNAVHGDGKQGKPRIYWDEFYHGEHGSLWEYVRQSPVRYLAWQGLFAALAALFAFSRRWGPVMAPVVEPRLSPLEFVDTLGGLYERAGAASIGVDAAYRQLRLLLTRQLSLPGNIDDNALAQAAGPRLGWPQAELNDVLREAAEARHLQRLNPSEALALVQRLESFSQRLDARTKLTRESR